MVRFSALVACLVMFTASAKADEPSPKQKAKASELVKQAITKSQAGDHESAIDLYNQAYMLVPTPLLLSNVASEYQQLGKKIEAVKYFCKYLTDDPNGANASYASAQARALQIDLGNDPDDKDPCKVKPKVVEPPPPPPGGGSGEPAGGGSAVSGTIGIDKTAPEPSHPGHGLEYTGIAVGIVGLAAFGAGVYYGMQAKDISDQITNHDPTMMWPTNIKQLQSDGQSDQTLQIAFMITGGVLAGAGVVMAVVGHGHATKDEHVSIAPTATPTSIGLAAAGHF